MKWVMAVVVLAVAVLHQDVWLWTNHSLVLGFLPIGLVYHLGYCILTSLTMWALVRYFWPAHLEMHEPALSTEAAPHEAR